MTDPTRVSATESTGTDPGKGAGDRAAEFFSAFTPERQKRQSLRFGVLGALASIALMIPIALLVRPDPQTYQVVTWRGIRAVSVGMSAPEVERQLGGPIATFRQGEAQCFRYGRASFKEPFAIHTACFEGGVLKDFTTKRFAAEKVELPGAKAQ